MTTIRTLAVPRRRALARLLSVGAAAVAIALGATACVAIPDTGRVEQGDTISDNSVNDFVFRPNGPVADSSQERILRDFIDAGTGPQDNYAVARQFLASSFASTWNPRSSVIIRPGVGSTTRTGDTKLDYTIASSATVDDGGHYVPTEDTSSTTLGFQFVQENGQWRISSAPDGIVLTPTAFDSVFQAHAVYFYDPTYKYLVPDTRWFLARTSTTTRIVSALLAGPSAWLQGAVVSAFPEGTQLSLNAVTVDDGTARVDVTADALSASPADRARMQAQLVASFSTVATVNAVQLTVQSSPISVPDSGLGTPVRDPGVDARPLVLSSGQFGFASTKSVSAIPGVSSAVVGLSPTSVELSSDQSFAVVGSRSGSYFARNDGSALRVDAREGLAPPALDDFGYLWSAVATSAGELTAFGPDGVPHPIASKLTAAGTLVSFRLSRDGTRAAALLEVDGASRLVVMAVIRDAQKVPTGLGDPLELAAPTGRPVDATWADESTVATLTDDGDSSTVTVAEVGGESRSSGRLSTDAVMLVGGNGVDRMRVITSTGAVLEPRGSSWQGTGITADLLATQR
ncbi:LpqB family beta-propeller domain-containing protein [Frigoribacterium sp. 2-23]|uniref:LpqB family beta-propeller domain-containing protein n=1 Tax=Frigoribacterium sp. 2-23 TaxID=3415006 RepID=UPI003C702965